jgi:hypothetical protein
MTPVISGRPLRLPVSVHPRIALQMPCGHSSELYCFQCVITCETSTEVTTIGTSFEFMGLKSQSPYHASDDLTDSSPL